MFKDTRVRMILALAGFVIAILVVVAVNQIRLVNKAHSSFENYYAFRGCQQLLSKTDTYGICKTDTGQTIKIVLFKGKWYLDGDLPTCPANFCF